MVPEIIIKLIRLVYIVQKYCLYGNEKGTNQTALIEALENKRPDIAMLLIEKGADVNIVSGLTSGLIEALRGGYLDIVKKMIEKNAYVNITTDLGWSPMIIAAIEGHTMIIKD